MKIRPPSCLSSQQPRQKAGCLVPLKRALALPCPCLISLVHKQDLPQTSGLNPPRQPHAPTPGQTRTPHQHTRLHSLLSLGDHVRIHPCREPACRDNGRHELSALAASFMPPSSARATKNATGTEDREVAQGSRILQLSRRGTGWRGNGGTAPKQQRMRRGQWERRNRVFTKGVRAKGARVLRGGARRRVPAWRWERARGGVRA